jgi:hypothetical protein
MSRVRSDRTRNSLTASTTAGNTFGIVSSQLNTPRQIQLALKLTY